MRQIACDVVKGVKLLLVSENAYFLNAACQQNTNRIGKIMAKSVGAVGILLTGGRKKKGIFGKLTGGLGSLYGITSYLSDVLSYSRLLALGLATGVVAQVFNTGLSGRRRHRGLYPADCGIRLWYGIQYCN